MRLEHEEGRALLRVMADGDDRQVTEAIERYAALLRIHIEKENGILFPLAEQLLPEEDRRVLMQAFDAVEQALCDPDFRQRLLRELARLEAAGTT